VQGENRIHRSIGHVGDLEVNDTLDAKIVIDGILVKQEKIV
jgi:hypothetical protein